MTQERLWQGLDPSWGDLRVLLALLCSSAAAVVLLTWLGRRQVQQKMDGARRSQHLALEGMEKAAHRLKEESPGTQTSHILSLTVVELAEKLKEGSLSPKSVLYSYTNKVSTSCSGSQLSVEWAAPSYTNLYNVLSFPAGVVLVSTVTRAEELKQYRGHYRDPWDRRLEEAVSGAVGMTRALPWQEELCLPFFKEALARGTKRNV